MKRKRLNNAAENARVIVGPAQESVSSREDEWKLLGIQQKLDAL